MSASDDKSLHQAIGWLRQVLGDEHPDLIDDEAALADAAGLPDIADALRHHFGRRDEADR